VPYGGLLYRGVLPGIHGKNRMDVLWVLQSRLLVLTWNSILS